jgi:hypothetical protein
VDTHRAEVMTEAGLEEGTTRLAQWLARF